MKKLYLKWRNCWGILLVLGGVVLVLAMLATSPTGTRAQERLGYEKATPDFVPAGRTDESGGHHVIDRDSVAYGRTYAEWMAAWDQWSYSLPVDTHPLFTDGDCSVGQSGPVWFLGGAFVAPWTRVRHCNIPADTALFFPVWDWEDSALEETVEHPGDGVQVPGPIALLRAKVANLVDLKQTGRQDGRHVLILARVLPAYLGDLRASARDGRMTERKLVGFLEELLAVVVSPNGRKACAGLKIDPLEFFAELTAEGLPRVQSFLAKRLPRALASK